jgi:hypothetical protein
MNCLANISDVFSSIAVLFAIATAGLHFTLAAAVCWDAVKVEQKRRLWFLGALSWGLATFLTGIVGATAYWLMHRSTLAGDAVPGQTMEPRAHKT